MRKTFNLNDGTPAVVLTNSDCFQVWTTKPGNPNAIDINISCDNINKVNPDTYLEEINIKWQKLSNQVNSVFVNIKNNTIWEDAEVIEPAQLSSHVD